MLNKNEKPMDVTEAESKEFLEAVANIPEVVKSEASDDEYEEIPRLRVTVTRTKGYRRRQAIRHSRSRRHHYTYYMFDGDKGITVKKPYLRRSGGHHSNVTTYYKGYGNRKVRRIKCDEDYENAVTFNHGKYKRIFDYAWTID